MAFYFIKRGFSNSIPKLIMKPHQARPAILKGAGLIAQAVKATLGPGGRNVVIEAEKETSRFEHTLRPPTITKDGVTVAKSIDLINHQL